MYHCHVEDSSGYGTAAVIVGWYNCIANFYDCVFTRNHQQALVYYLADGGKVVRCRFSDNTGVDAWTGTTSGGLGVGATPLEPIEIRDCVFERNVAAAGASGGGAGVSGGTTIWRNVTFISNSASAGGALELSNFAHATMIGCNFPKNSAGDCGSSFSTDKSTLVVFNSTVSENVGHYCGMFQIRETVFSFHNCTFRDYVSTAYFNVGLVASASSGTFTNCLVMNNQAPGSDGLNAQDGSIVRIERSVWVNNRVEGGRACLYAFSGGSITVDDSDFINCHSEGTDGTPGGTAYVTTDGTITFTNSRIVGSSANSKGAVAYVGAGGTLRLASTMITDSGGDSKFAIHDASGSDFAVQVKNETGGERFIAQHHIVLPHVAFFFHIAARFSHRRRDGEYFLDRQRFGSKRRRAHQHGYEERYSRSVCRYVELLPHRLVRRRDCRHRVQVHVQGRGGHVSH
jgi:hypothetical protein